VTDHAKRVVYKPDAILPDPQVDGWIVAISQKLAAEIKSQSTARPAS